MVSEEPGHPQPHPSRAPPEGSFLPHLDPLTRGTLSITKYHDSHDPAKAALGLVRPGLRILQILLLGVRLGVGLLCGDGCCALA